MEQCHINIIEANCFKPPEEFDGIHPIFILYVGISFIYLYFRRREKPEAIGYYYCIISRVWKREDWQSLLLACDYSDPASYVSGQQTDD